MSSNNNSSQSLPVDLTTQKKVERLSQLQKDIDAKREKVGKMTDLFDQKSIDFAWCSLHFMEKGKDMNSDERRARFSEIQHLKHVAFAALSVMVDEKEELMKMEMSKDNLCRWTFSFV